MESEIGWASAIALQMSGEHGHPGHNENRCDHLNQRLETARKILSIAASLAALAKAFGLV